MHCLTAWGQWAVQFVQYNASLQHGGRGVLPRRRLLWGQWAVDLLQYTASLPWGSGPCNSCNALPHRLRAVGSGTLAMRGPTNSQDGECCPGGCHCPKSGTPAMHCHTAWARWAVELMACTASLPGGSGWCKPCNTLPHCSRGDGESCPGGGCCLKSGTPAMHCHTA